MWQRRRKKSITLRKMKSMDSKRIVQCQHGYQVNQQLRRCEACVRGRGRNADHRRLAAESEHLMDTISIGYAFFGEKDQTAKPVLIVREHRCRWTEAIPVLNKGSQDTWAVKSLAESVRRTGLKRFIFKSDQEPAIIEKSTRSWVSRTASSNGRFRRLLE